MEKNIIEWNKLIGVFHGWKHSPTPKQKGKGLWNFPEWGKSAFDLDSFKYHTSWDWLMPCIAKFNDMVKMEEIEHDMESSALHDIIELAIYRVDILLAHSQFVRLIEWYNQQSK